jgi:hypothetical protein
MRAIVGLCALCGCACAQQAITYGLVGGRVEDGTGSPVAGAPVRIRHVQRDQLYETRTGPHGRFQFLYVPPGDLELRADSLSFQPALVRLTIAAGQSLDVPIRLSLEARSDSLVVEATAPLIETARTQVSDRVSPVEIEALPLNGRNYVDLALLVPGVSRTTVGAPQTFVETSAVPGANVSVAGQRNLNNTFVLDGLSANDDAAGIAGTYLSQEVIREFQVVTSGADAEFGRASSGVVAVATRSGTNDWHGRAYSYLRNQRFDSRNPLASRKDPLTQVQYGFTAGGPLRRGRTFQFSNVEQTRRNAAGFVTISPANIASINTVLDAFHYPGPRISTGEYGTGYDTTTFLSRLDQSFGNRHQLFVRYNLYDIGSANARSVGGLNDISRGTSLWTTDHNIALNETAAISPNLLNEVRFQITRSRLSAPGNDLVGPAVNISGVANFGASTTSPVGRDTDLYEASNTVTLSRGSHFIKAGADFLLNRVNIYFPGSAVAAVYSFTSLATLQAGRYNTVQQAFGDPYQFQSNPNLGLYVQDEWKVTPAFSLHAGLRYDLQWLPSPIRTDPDNLAPRFGLAWSPGDRRTVFRASYGMYYDRIPLRATSNALQRDGSKYRVALLSFGQAGAPAFPRQFDEFPGGQYINITTIDPDISNSYAHQASAQIERQVGSRTTLTAAYQWTRALHLILSRNNNVPTLTAADAAAQGIPNLGRPDSRYGNVSRYESSGDSYFNGLLLSAATRFGRANQLRVSYTLSKAIDNIGNFFFSTPQNNFDLRDDRSLSDNDQRHRVTASALLTWRGWQFAPLFVYTSALPLNTLLTFDRNYDTNLNDRPNGVGRNTARGFNYISLDARVSRRFRLSERWSIESLAESFNTLNRTNRAAPNNVLNASFGQATAVFDARQIQFGLRLNF